MLYKTYTTKRNFGVELEVGNSISKEIIKNIISTKSNREIRIVEWEQSRNNNFWHIKEDSTCGPNAHFAKDYGWEIASFKASGIKDLVEIATVATALNKGGIEVNDNCGLHVHVEVPEFSEAQMGILLAWWIKIEPFICRLLPSRRIKNKHCKLYCSEKKLISLFNEINENKSIFLWELFKPCYFQPHENYQKRKSLNFVNFAEAIWLQQEEGIVSDRKTIELRLPEGTLDKDNIMSWVKIIVLFVENMVKAKLPDNLSPANLTEFLQIIGLEDKEEFLILSDGLRKTKLWIFKRFAESDVHKTKKIFKEIEEKKSFLF